MPPPLSLFLPFSLSLSLPFSVFSLIICKILTILYPLPLFPLQSSGDRSDKERDHSSSQSSSSGISNGLEAVKVWQERFHDVESSYKDSMVANAQLYNEKTALVFQVEVLKDR